jgi:hypothetical protein
MAYYTRTAAGALRGKVGGGFRLGYTQPVVQIDYGEDGVALFSATIENADTVASWADQELAFGQEFAKADVPAGTRVRAVIDNQPIPCQLSNRRVWADGSLKFADVRMLVPAIVAGGTKTISWQKVVGDWATHDTPMHTSTSAIRSKVTLEYAFPSWKGRNSSNVLTAERGPKIFNSNVMLAASNSEWIDTVMGGPVCCEWRASDYAVIGAAASGQFTADFGNDFTLTADQQDANFGALLYARAWGGTPGNPKRIQFLYRTVQGWSTDIPADEQGSQVNINLSVNGTVVRGAGIGTAGWSSVNTWKGGFLVSAGTEGTMDWYDVQTSSFVTPPKLVYRRNIPYGVRAKFIPPFDTANPAMPMTAASMTYLPAKRGPLRPNQSDVADAIMIPWTTSKPMAWNIAAHARATAAQILGHQRYARAAAFGMGAMTGIGLHRDTRKIISYLPPSKQTNENDLGTSIYGLGKPASAAAALRPEITNLDAAHFPQMAFWSALDEGSQHMLDLAYHEVTLPGLFSGDDDGFKYTSVVTGTTAVPVGGLNVREQIRSTTHNARPLGNALGLGNPADPHWIMVRDYVDHWAEMTARVVLEEDYWRGGLNESDGRRFQDVKAIRPNNEPTYKVWMHTIGLGAMAHSYGMSEYAKLQERTEWFAHLPTVLGGGWHNDNDYLMKPDASEAVGYQVHCMDGLTGDPANRYPNTLGSPSTNVRYRRYWKFGQWSSAFTDCTYKADGQTIAFAAIDAPYGSSTMLNGMIVTVAATRGVAEPHWADATKMPPLGLTPGFIYYSVQASGLTCKLSTTLNGSPVTFTPLNGVDQAGHIFRRPVAGVHPMKNGTDLGDTTASSNGYCTQVISALDMVQHYVMPTDPRLLLARQKLYNLKATSTGPNAWDERSKTTVPLTGTVIIPSRTGAVTASFVKLTATSAASRSAPASVGDFNSGFSTAFAKSAQPSPPPSGVSDFSSEFTTEFT